MECKPGVGLGITEFGLFLAPGITLGRIVGTGLNEIEGVVIVDLTTKIRGLTARFLTVISEGGAGRRVVIIVFRGVVFPGIGMGKAKNY